MRAGERDRLPAARRGRCSTTPGLGRRSSIWGTQPAIIVPLETAKLLGVAAVLSNVSPFLKNLAYAGLF